MKKELNEEVENLFSSDTGTINNKHIETNPIISVKVDDPSIYYTEKKVNALNVNMDELFGIFKMQFKDY